MLKVHFHVKNPTPGPNGIVFRSKGVQSIRDHEGKHGKLKFEIIYRKSQLSPRDDKQHEGRKWQTWSPWEGKVEYFVG